MDISADKNSGELPAILTVQFTKDMMTIGLNDGRILSVPLAWYPKLATANQKQLKKFRISPTGYGIHWPDLDEDLSVYGFLFPQGRHSQSVPHAAEPRKKYPSE